MFNGKPVIGIIAEFNPFHEGHKFLIDSIKKQYPHSYIVAVMSGDFVQRGLPAITDKYTRAHTAIKNGIDMVIEMPIECSTAPSTDFAMCGVSILDIIGFVDFLAFGAEHPDEIKKVKEHICNENIEEKNIIKEELKKGSTYPKAMCTAFGYELGSNDILGIEYLKALDKIESKIRPLIFQRNFSFAQAHEIRERADRILNSRYKIHEYDIFKMLSKYPLVFPNDFSEYLNYKLLLDSSMNINFSEYYDIKEELSNAMKKTVYEPLSFTERVLKLKSKNYTYSHISRALIHIMLGIKTSLVEKIKNEGYYQYIRVLAIRKISEKLLSAILPYYITGLSPKQIEPITDKNSLELNVFASNLYNSICGNNQNEKSRKFIVDMV